MNQAFWKTYKSKVLQTLSGESEEDLTEEVGTIHAWWGMEREVAVVKGTKKGKGQAQRERERGTFVQKQLAQMAGCHVRKPGGSRKLRKKRRLRGHWRSGCYLQRSQSCHMEEILLGPMANGHTEYTQLNMTFSWAELSRSRMLCLGTGGRESDTCTLKVTVAALDQSHTWNMFVLTLKKLKRL